MLGVGLFIVVFGYAVIYWGIQAIQGNSQGSFLSYIFPFGQGTNSLGSTLSPGKPATSNLALTSNPKGAAANLAQTQKSQTQYGGH